MWTCSKCGQRVDDTFEICWKCGTASDGTEDPDFFSQPEDTSPVDTLTGHIPLGTEERLVTVTSCSLPTEALALRLKLEDAGIPVFLADEYTVVMDWLLSNAIGGIKVQVPESQALRACQLLGTGLPDETSEEVADREDQGPDERIQRKEEGYRPLGPDPDIEEEDEDDEDDERERERGRD